ncbi:MAG: hypothetical protein H7337_06825 [Rhizobacter sp.]|nr:hypothetical protein [Rhizobacter sp.]
MLPYAWLGLIDVCDITTSLVLMPHIRPVLFYRPVYAGKFLTGAKLLWDGLK